MNLNITKEKVLDAANKCPVAKETLKTLFPEVFEEDKYFDLSKLIPIKDYMGDGGDLFTNSSVMASGLSSGAIWIRSAYDLAYKGFGLSVGYNWSIMVDKVGVKVLVPTKR